MKRARLATSGLEDFVTDSSILFAHAIDCDDAAALKQALVFLKGTLREAMRAKEEVMRAKEDEMTRLREEKEAEAAAKLDLMVEVRILKKQVEDQAEAAKILADSQREKEDPSQSRFALMEKVKLAEKEKEDANISKLELIEKVKLANSETAKFRLELEEVARSAERKIVKEERKNAAAKLELIEKVKLANSETAEVKSELAEVTRKLAQAEKDKETEEMARNFEQAKEKEEAAIASQRFELKLQAAIDSLNEKTKRNLSRLESEFLEMVANAESHKANKQTSAPKSFARKRSL